MVWNAVFCDVFDAEIMEMDQLKESECFAEATPTDKILCFKTSIIFTFNISNVFAIFLSLTPLIFSGLK